MITPLIGGTMHQRSIAALSLLVAGASGCSVDCIDSLPPVAAFSTAAPAPSREVPFAAPGALWWVPEHLRDGTLTAGESTFALETVFETGRLVALRVPDGLTPESGATLSATLTADDAVYDLGVRRAQGEPHAVDVVNTDISASSAALPVGSSFCSDGPFDTPPPPTFRPALRITLPLDPADLASVAIDIFPIFPVATTDADGDEIDDVDELSPRLADTASPRDGFRRDWWSSRRDAPNGVGSVLDIPVDAGRYAVRLRSLFDGATSELLDVTVE